MIIIGFILALCLSFLIAYYLNTDMAVFRFKEILPLLLDGAVIIIENKKPYLKILKYKEAYIKVITKSEFKFIKQFLIYHENGNYYALN